MKKIMALFAATLICTNLTFAYIEEGKTSDIQVMQNQGYSQSALRIVDTINFQSRGVKKYDRRYKKTEPSGYAYVKRYLDPLQDDDNFGEHEINFTNTWNNDEPHYTTTKVKNGVVENL